MSRAIQSKCLVALSAVALLPWIGCTLEDNVGSLLDAITDQVEGIATASDEDDEAPPLADRGGDSGGGSTSTRPPRDGLQDGNSNTIELDEDDVPQFPDRRDPISGEPNPGGNDDDATRGDAETTPADDEDATPGDDQTPPGGQQPPPGGQDPGFDEQEAIRELTALFGNNEFEFGSSTGSSDNSNFLTGSTDLFLCASGEFFMRVTTIFSGSLPGGGVSQSFEEDTAGTWAIVFLEGQQPAIELTVQQSTDANIAPVIQILINSDAAGRLFLDGALATVTDATQACGS